MTDSQSTGSSPARPASFQDAVLQLAEAEALLRIEQDDYDYQRAVIEQQIISDAGGESAYGKNKEDRERFLAARLPEHPAYAASLAELRRVQRIVGVLKAYVEAMRFNLRQAQLDADNARAGEIENLASAIRAVDGTSLN